MACRLVALCFSVVVMTGSAAACYLLGQAHHHAVVAELGSTNVLPLISRIFLTKSGLIYFHPVLFAFLSLWGGRKFGQQKEAIWCLVVINLGMTLLFLAFFNLALGLYDMPPSPHQMTN